MKLRITVALAAAVALAALTGCTSNKPANPVGDPPTPDASISAPPTEGPAAQPHAWDNGLTMKIVSAEKMDPKLTSDLKPDQTSVKITATLTNPGGQAVPLQNGYLAWWVLSGPNRTQCDETTGWTTTGDQLRFDLPQQVGAGQTVTIFDSSNVPTGELGVLAVQTGPAFGDMPQWTFTGAEKLWKG